MRIALEMTLSPLQTWPSKVRATPDLGKFTDLVLEMAAELLSLEADGILLGQKCQLLYRNEPATPGWAVNLIRKFPAAGQKRK
jgi:hypothetical protein